VTGAGTILRAAALLGTETRYVLRLYAARVFLAFTAILAVVLSLDLAINLDQLIQSQGPLEDDMQGRLVWYVVLRMGYNLPAIVPIATALGVLWAEWGLARSNERMMIANSGRAPALSLMPAIVLGLILGALQFVAVAHIQPRVMEEQALAGYRDYGPRFRGELGPLRWIQIEDAVIRARIDFSEGPEPVLREVRAFMLGPDGHLSDIVDAALARPTGRPGIWTLSEARIWTAAAHGAGAITVATEVELALSLEPLWLGHADIVPRFLPQHALRALSAATGGVPRQWRFSANLTERRSAPLVLLAFAVMTATLCMKMLGPRGPLVAALKIGALGYAVHVALKTMAALAEYGYLSPLLGAWLVPGVVLAVCAWVLAREEWQVHRALGSTVQAGESRTSASPIKTRPSGP
jgi:lipopolysaccharide export system permease protein